MDTSQIYRNWIGKAAACAAVTIAWPVQANSAPPVPPAGLKWVQIPELSDEFSGAALDGSKWRNGHPYWKGRSPSKYDPSGVYVSGGLLHLRSTIDPSASKTGDWIRSACVTSFTPIVSFGYYEAKIKASRLPMLSSFWFQNKNKGDGTASEIDVIEAVGGNERKPEDAYIMNSTIHLFSHNWTNDASLRKTVRMDSPVTTWHVYGVWWADPRTAFFYLDGKKISELHTSFDLTPPLFMFFDTEADGNFSVPNASVLNDDAKNTMLVDWVRSYKLQPR